jgi:hypothetical protein
MIYYEYVAVDKFKMVLFETMPDIFAISRR